MPDDRTAAVTEALARGPARFSSLRVVIPNPRTLSRRLHLLVARGWVAHDGPVYRLTKRGERAAGLWRELSALEASPPEISVDRVPRPVSAAIVRWTAERLRDRFPAEVAGVLVFGSVARGRESGDSDIDLLVLIRGGASALETVRQGLLEFQREFRSTEEYRAARRAGFYPVLDVHLISLEEAYRLHRLYLDALLDGIPVFDPDRRLADLTGRMRARLNAAGSVRIETPDGMRYWELKDPELLGGPL